jgi:2-desacetyl-2-hydroxyethyl bacteriochlorophyllide A dehydrogenase
MTMRRVTVRAQGVVLVDAERPEPGPGEVLVEPTVIGVCGSDVHAAAGHHPFVSLPYNPGHEVVGVVRQLGSGVTDVQVDDRVVVEPTLPCWSCKHCRAGRINLCEQLRFFGCVHDQGGMADYFTIPANRVHVLPAEMSDRQAVLIEPLATPVHAVALSGGVADAAVAIIGAGTIGLLVLAASRAAGARRVVMTDVQPGKRARALRLGADAVVDADRPDVVEAMREELGESADVVFDCVAVQGTVDQAVRLAMKGGSVMIVGVPASPVTVPLPEVQDQQVRMQGSAMFMPADFIAATRMIQTGHVREADLITAQFPLEKAAEAFAASASGQEVKVVLTH